MKCVYDAVLLSRYLEQDLPPEVMESVDIHLEECQACTMELERLRTAIVIIKSAEEVTAPRNYTEEVRIKMDEKDLRN